MCSTPSFAQSSPPAPPAPPATETPQAVEQEPARLEDIIVTAQKRSENLQRVPIAVTALTTDQILQTGLTNTQDLPLVTPGLLFSNSIGYVLPRIRSVGTSGNAPGVENAVATYVDGVYYASQFGASQNLAGVSQIEVLKGPQGTLFGRNATGGLIQVSTKDPSAKTAAEFTAGYGNYDAFTATGYLTGGLAEGLSANIFAQYEHMGDGYGTNFFNGKDVYKVDHDYSIRAKLLYDSNGTFLRLSADYFNQRTSSPALMAVQPEYGVPTFGNSYSGDYNVNLNNQPLIKIKGGGTSLYYRQDVGSFQLVSISAFRYDEFFNDLDFDVGPNPIINSPYNQKDQQFTQEIQLQSERSGPLRYTLGFFYLWSKARWDPYQVNLGGPLVAPLARVEVFSHQTSRSYSGFAEATYELAPATHVTGGFRYTWESKHAAGATFGFLPGLVPVGQLGPDADQRQQFKTPTWRLSVDHRFSKDLMVYASYNRGYKSGGYNLSTPASPGYDSERIDAYEAGFKSELANGTVRLNAAAFYYDYANIQVARYVEGAILIYNGAKARIYGLDADAQWAISSHFELSAGASLLHDRFTSFADADIYSINPAGGYFLVSGDASGNRLPYAADFTGSLGGTYKTDVGDGQLSANVTGSFVSGYYPEVGNVYKQASYVMINGSISYAFENGLSAQLYMKNIADERVAAQVAYSPTGTGLALDPPRTYGITLGYKF